MNLNFHLDKVRKDLDYIRRDITVVNRQLIELGLARITLMHNFRFRGQAPLGFPPSVRMRLNFLSSQISKLESDLARLKYLETFSESRLSVLLV